MSPDANCAPRSLTEVYGGVQRLQRLVGSVTTSILRHDCLGPDQATMADFLSHALLEEESGHPTLELSTIQTANLQFFVILLQIYGRVKAVSGKHVGEVSLAESLEEAWTRRFPGQLYGPGLVQRA